MDFSTDRWTAYKAPAIKISAVLITHAHLRVLDFILANARDEARRAKVAQHGTHAESRRRLQHVCSVVSFLAQNFLASWVGAQLLVEGNLDASLLSVRA